MCYCNGVYIVLVGFVEVGEIFEQVVVCEVMEESGIWVKNLCYVIFQLWLFLQLLMIVFMVDYVDGEIVVDKKELLIVDWYCYDDLLFLLLLGIVVWWLIEDIVVMCWVEFE